MKAFPLEFHAQSETMVVKSIFLNATHKFCENRKRKCIAEDEEKYRLNDLLISDI